MRLRAALAASLRAERVALLQDAARLYEPRARAGDAAALAQLATLALLLGRPDAALETFERALSLAPHQAGASQRLASLGKVEALLALGRSVDAMQHVQPWLDELPDGWVLAALCAERAELVPQMIELARGAERTAVRGFAAPHRQELLDDVRALVAMAEGSPLSDGRGPLAQLAALMAGHDVLLPGARARDADPGVLRRVLWRVLRTGQAQWLVPLLDTPANELWPGLSELVTDAIVSLASGDAA